MNKPTTTDYCPICQKDGLHEVFETVDGLGEIRQYHECLRCTVSHTVPRGGSLIPVGLEED